MPNFFPLLPGLSQEGILVCREQPPDTHTCISSTKIRPNARVTCTLIAAVNHGEIRERGVGKARCRPNGALKEVQRYWFNIFARTAVSWYNPLFVHPSTVDSSSQVPAPLYFCGTVHGHRSFRRWNSPSPARDRSSMAAGVE